MIESLCISFGCAWVTAIWFVIRYERALRRIADHPGNRGSTQAMRAIATAALQFWRRSPAKRNRKPSPQLPLIEAPDADKG
jgi:hypothetical protein